MPDIVDHAPSPKSHIKTLMRIGYTLNSAAADVIDNAITAGAKHIDVYSPPGAVAPSISFLDDGCGMDRAELIENMRIGCKDPDELREKGDLGRFGSGMKTASFSQARRLTVVTRKKGQPLVAARWDIDNVEASNSWCLEVFGPDEIPELEDLSDDFPLESGTQIIWSKLTCIETGNHAKDHESDLAARLSELRKYLSLHFHRFMSGTDKRTFSINNTPIKPIDPFMVGEPGYQEGPSEKLRCKGGHIVIQTHVLPHFQKMAKQKLAALGGADSVTQNQGLYIYREKRLISAGGWLGMARNSQLGALARIQVDIPSALDNDWSTDVKKASLQMPAKVKRELRKFLADPLKRSKRIHRYRGTQDAANSFWKVNEDHNTKVITYEIDIENELLLNLARKSTAEDKQLLTQYLAKLASNLPINHIYEKMAERPQDVSQDVIDLTALEAALERAFEAKS